MDVRQVLHLPSDPDPPAGHQDHCGEAPDHGPPLGCHHQAGDMGGGCTQGTGGGLHQGLLHEDWRVSNGEQ